MIDLSKGFDVINRDILLFKLKKYGISPSSLNWFTSYLSDRKQFVQVNKINSELASVNMGVPQGTVLGPILYLIYTNDLDTVCDKAFTISYADDTSFGCHAKTADELQLKMNVSLSQISTWFKTNRLIINASKSSYIVIGTNQAVANISNLNILLNNQPLTRCSNTKLLGVYVDEQLNFQKHIQYLNNKISSKIGILHRLRKFLPPHILNIIYLTSIQTLLDYCITLWGPVSKSNINCLQRLQNRCARAVTGNFNRDSSVTYLVKSLDWMNMNQRLEYFTACLIYKCLNNSAPKQLAETFEYVHQHHDYRTRSATNKDLLLPRAKTSLFQHSFAYYGAKIWNQLPLNIRNSSSICTFKSNFKQTYKQDS